MSALLLCGLVGDTAFSDLSYTEALQHARESGRTLILYFASSGDAAARHMEETSWRSPLVMDWARRDGVVLRLEAEENTALAEEHGVQRLPAILWLRDGVEMKRRHGDVPPSSLISWLHTPPGELQSVEDLQRIFDDELAHPFSRLSARELLAERLEPEQTLQHYLWLWNEGATIDPDWPQQRRGFFASSMKQLADRYPPAADAFAALFEEAEVSVLEGTVDEGVWLDWLALGSHLDRAAELVEAIHALLVERGADAFPGLSRAMAWNFCRKQGDLAALGLLMTDPEAAARHIFELDEAQMKEMYEQLFGEGGHKYMGPFEERMLPYFQDEQRPERTRVRITDLFEPLLVAGRTRDALRVADVLLTNLDDLESRVALVESAVRADDTWRIASAGEDAFSRHLAGLSPPLTQARASLQTYLAEATELATTDGQRAAVERLATRLEDPEAR